MKNKTKIKVLQISHGLDPGGIEAFLLNIFENIDRDKFEVDFAVAADGKQFYEDRVLNKGAKVYHTSDLNGIRNIITHFFRLIKLLKNEGPYDVVHSHIDFINGINLFAAYIAGVPLRISHAHGTNSSGGENLKPSTFVRFYRFIMRFFILIFSNKYLGCSKDANEFMYGATNLKNSIFIPNGVDLSKFRTTKAVNVKHLSNLNFITIGRFVAAKNCLFLAQVLFEFSKIRQDFKMNWVGVGPLEQELKKYVLENNLEQFITFLGSRNDINQLLNKSDFMLFPSQWEGLPVTLIEAQASETPCFISENITDEANIGLCTVISIKKNAEEWAQELNSHIINKTFNKKINKIKLNTFNVKNVVLQIEGIYSEI